MSDVSVIGTGSMGSALVEVLAGSGAEVTVWNRTRETAEALSRPEDPLGGIARGGTLVESETTDPSAEEMEGSVDVMGAWAAELASLLREAAIDSRMQ